MTVERLRGRAGQAQRLRRLKRTNGLCEHCLAKGRRRAAVVVNHIVALIHGGSDEDSNTENLCRSCDRVATAKQFGHQVAQGSRGIGSSGRPTNPDHAWNRAGQATPAADPPRPRRRPAGGRGVESAEGPAGGHRAVRPCAAGGVSK